MMMYSQQDPRFPPQIAPGNGLTTQQRRGLAEGKEYFNPDIPGYGMRRQEAFGSFQPGSDLREAEAGRVFQQLRLAVSRSDWANASKLLDRLKGEYATSAKDGTTGWPGRSQPSIHSGFAAIRDRRTGLRTRPQPHLLH